MPRTQETHLSVIPVCSVVNNFLFTTENTESTEKSPLCVLHELCGKKVCFNSPPSAPRARRNHLSVFSVSSGVKRFVLIHHRAHREHGEITSLCSP